MPAPQGAPANSQPQATDSVTPGVADATETSRGTAAQDLVTILAKDMASDAKIKTDADALQAAVPDARSSPAPSNSDSVPVAPNPLAHLAVAAHFSVQHTPAPANTGELKSTLGSSAWSDELGGQLTWMAQNGLQTGSLRVTPEHLGPVEVQITVRNGDASVWFGASHPDTRAALEQALPRLRALFASQGMTLTDSGVSRESPRNPARSPSTQGIAAVSAAGSLSEPVAVRVSLGLVDTYA